MENVNGMAMARIYPGGLLYPTENPGQQTGVKELF